MSSLSLPPLQRLKVSFEPKPLTQPLRSSLELSKFSSLELCQDILRRASIAHPSLDGRDGIESVSIDEIKAQFIHAVSTYRYTCIEENEEKGVSLHKVKLCGRTYLVKQISHLGLSKPKDIKREASVGTKISSHPFILNSIASYSARYDTFLLMEYIEGVNLDHPDAVERFSLAEEFHPERYKSLIGLTRALLLALAHTHSQGVVHRDIKSANIMISLEGEYKVKLLDWGISRSLATVDGCIEGEKRAEDEPLTTISPPPLLRATSLVGTWNFVAPEVVKEEAYDFSVDIWSLGVTIYKLATGKEPFLGDVKHEYFRSVLSEPILIPDHFPLEFADLIMQMLSKDPGSRKNAMELLCHPALKSQLFPIDKAHERLHQIKDANQAQFISHRRYRLLKSPRSISSWLRDSSSDSSGSW